MDRKKLDIKLIGSWWFGVDIFDLHKSIFMTLSKKMRGSSVLINSMKTFK